MPHTLKEVRQIAFELPEEDRRQLASSLWDSIESESAIGEKWKIEVERRVNEIDSGAVPLIDGATVKQEFAKIRARLACPK